MGFKRNLTASEIVNQVIFFARLGNINRINVVFMGMGEPFLNYSEVIKAIRILNDKDGFNIGMRETYLLFLRIGIPEGLEEFSTENMQVNLAISLHAPNDNLRKLFNASECWIGKTF